MLLLPATSSQPVTAGDRTHLERDQSSCDFDEVVVSELPVDVDDDDVGSDVGSDVDLEVDRGVDDVSVSVDGLVERVPELSFVVEVSGRLPVRVSDPVVSVEVGAAGVTATRADGSRSTVARFPTAAPVTGEMPLPVSGARAA